MSGKYELLDAKDYGDYSVDKLVSINGSIANYEDCYNELKKLQAENAELRKRIINAQKNTQAFKNVANKACNSKVNLVAHYASIEKLLKGID